MKYLGDQDIIVELPGIFVSGFRISKWCDTILWNVQGWSFDFSGISKDRVTNLETTEFFSKKGMSLASVWIFFWNNKTFNLSNMMGYQALVSHASDEKHIFLTNWFHSFFRPRVTACRKWLWNFRGEQNFKFQTASSRGCSPGYWNS